MHSPPSGPAEYDVVIVGGALSGAATAVVLLREQPDLRVLILERSVVLGRRVGEATVEVSSYFLTRVLGLSQHLNEQHLLKQGLRFWFANAASKDLGACSEIGARYLARVPAFLVDRAVLDEEVLRRAVARGAELWRPATVQKVVLTSGGLQTLTVRYQDQVQEVVARWMIDASGVAALLARQEGWFVPNDAHPTNAVWSRWQGVKDLDGEDLATRYPDWAGACYGLRRTATNHLMGAGWWAWFIPLKDGDVSVGLVFDQRLVDWPREGSLGQRLKDFLSQHPVGRELLQEARWQEGDVHWRKQLPYVSSTQAGDGFVLVGDAAGFLDPFYSPGLDWMTFTVSSAVQLIVNQRRGLAMAPLVARHNTDFARSYQRWFESIYQDKYEYLGDFELMRIAFIMDLGFYYLGVASQPFRRGTAALRESVFSTGPSVPFYYLMRAYNRRLARMAVSRRARGVYGKRNHQERFLFGGFTFARASGLHVLRGLAWWAKLELGEGWRTWFRKKTKRTESPLTESPPAPARTVVNPVG